MAHLKDVIGDRDFSINMISKSGTTTEPPLLTVITAIGAGIGVWGVINLLEGYGNDNAGSKSQGIKQLMAGGGIIILAQTVIPLLSSLFGGGEGGGE